MPRRSPEEGVRLLDQPRADAVGRGRRALRKRCGPGEPGPQRRCAASTSRLVHVADAALGAERDQEADVVDAPLDRARGEVDVPPVLVGLRGEEGEDEGGEAQLVLPQLVEAAQLLDQRVIRRRDLGDAPRDLGGRVRRGVEPERERDGEQHRHDRDREHGAAVLRPEPERVGLVLADDRPVRLVGLRPLRQPVELAGSCQPLHVRRMRFVRPRVVGVGEVVGLRDARPAGVQLFRRTRWRVLEERDGGVPTR